MSDQQRLDDLESRLAFQEDSLDKMSDVMARQSLEIDKLTRMVKHLNQQVKTLGSDNISAPEDEAPPPHY
ncbi:SlyX family protein [Amphritea sp. HPY]|uniref:SlyX family protein n=1 Tax=Amphritea sp. HPY TaxID=3421652 RepID=UPI003D7EFA7C